MAESKGELITTTADLPGGASVDDKLLQQAVDEINDIYVRKGLEMYLDMGNFILGAFFGGDTAKFLDGAKDHMSFRELANREDLIPSYSHLYNAVAVVGQLPQIPEDLRERLSVSHHKALLPMKDEKAKERLAKKAVDKGLSVPALRAEVQKALSKLKGKSRAGRPPLPGFVKGIHKLVKDIDAIEAVEFDEDEFEHYSPTDAKKLLVDLEAQVKALDTYRQKVYEQIEAWEKDKE